MKRKIFQFAIMSVFLLGIDACKKTPTGFLSPYLHYEVDPIIIPKGRAFLSSGLNGDGTSQPYTATVVHFYNKATGENADALFNKTYPVATWIALYNPKTDTTLALINAKLKTVNVPPISVIPHSGQIVANFGALNVPAGEYQFDLEIKNDAGSRLYPKIGDFILADTSNFETTSLGVPYDHLFEVGNETVTGVAANPILTVTRTGDTPNTITVQFLDKNGDAFDPAKGEIARRPNTGLNPNPAYLQTLQDYTNSFTITDNAMIFQYPFTPFPLNSLGNGFNIYYRIPTQYFKLDNPPLGNGQVVQWSLNPRFALQIYVPGAYTVTMQLPDVTRIPAP